MSKLRLLIILLLALTVGTTSRAQFISAQRTPEQPTIPSGWDYVPVSADAAPTYESSLQLRLQHALDSVYASTSIAGRYGVSASIVVPGQQWTGVAGISQLNVPLTTHHLMEVASNTKTFIAATILKLEEEGKLAITDRISRYLPYFANVDSSITIQQLLEHSSGIYDYLNDDTSAVLLIDAYTKRPSHRWTPEEILATIGAPNFRPHQSYQYCNTGFILLGMIIQHITGHTVGEELRSRFFVPQRLTHTFAGVDDSITGEFAHQWFPAYAADTAWDLGWIDHTAQLSLAWSAGYVVSTPEDLVRWADALYRGKLLTAASMTKMLKMNTWPDGTKYGLGTAQAPYGAKKAYGHTGGLPGFNSAMYSIPRDSVAIVVITNSDGLSGDPSVNDYLLALLAEVYRPVKASVTAQRPPMAYQMEGGRTLRVEAVDRVLDPTVRFYDVLGRAYEVRGEMVSNGMRVDLRGLPRGAYTYDLKVSEQHQFGRVFCP